MTRDLLDAFLQDLGTLYRMRRMYPAGNEQVVRAAGRASASLTAWGRRVRIAWVGEDLLVEDRTLADPPVALRALLERLAATGREGLHFDPEAEPQELQTWVECLLRGDVEQWEGRHIRVGSLALDKTQAPSDRLTRAAAGYLSLIPQVQEALSDLGREKAGGLTRAREIVRAIASQLATGEELVNPIRDLKTHDDYTFTHALNVCVISAAIGRSLGLTKGLVDVISLAALCHDVGKEKVPSEILNKRGALDPKERAIMDRHPVEGAALLVNLPEGVEPLLPVVAYEHHIGADGSGYPARPAGRQAHAASLLVAVADVYDALRTVRAYQEPRSAADAFSVMLERGRGGILHATFLGAFAHLLDVLRPSDPVILSDGRQARVLERRTHDPVRPLVEAEDGEVLDLGRSPDLWVRTIVEPQRGRNGAREDTRVGREEP